MGRLPVRPRLGDEQRSHEEFVLRIFDDTDFSVLVDAADDEFRVVQPIAERRIDAEIAVVVLRRRLRSVAFRSERILFDPDGHRPPREGTDEPADEQVGRRGIVFLVLRARDFQDVPGEFHDEMLEAAARSKMRDVPGPRVFDRAKGPRQTLEGASRGAPEPRKFLQDIVAALPDGFRVDPFVAERAFLPEAVQRPVEQDVVLVVGAEVADDADGDSFYEEISFPYVPECTSLSPSPIPGDAR